MPFLLTVFGSFITWIGTYLAAKWGVKVALIASVVATYASMWGVVMAALTGLVSLMPVSPFPSFLLQFFPDSSSVSLAITAYFGSMIARRSIEFWRMTFNIAVGVGAS